mmetsp:Transcript_34708/g.98346  ORF Transcript_34708/g.98346 Transcript_34708/m.98346 type:complete len:336 (-) Transcript_34708:308-1315(-)
MASRPCAGADRQDFTQIEPDRGSRELDQEKAVAAARPCNASTSSSRKPDAPLDPLLRFARGETAELYGWPRTTVLAFLLGLMLGALAVGIVSSNSAQRAYLRCIKAAPRLQASQECATNAQMLEAELSKAQARVEKLSQECGLCHSCDLVAASSVRMAKTAWDKEKEQLIQSEKEALGSRDVAEVRATEAEQRCQKHVEIAATSAAEKTLQDAKALHQQAADKREKELVAAQAAVEKAYRVRDAAEEDRDTARKAHALCLENLHQASVAHEHTNRTHAAETRQIASGLADLRRSAGDCEARHSEVRDALCYACKTCRGAVELPGCKQCKGQRGWL